MELSLIDRLVVAYLIATIQQVNREDGRVVVALSTRLKLDELHNRTFNLKEADPLKYPYDLTRENKLWLLTQIEKLFAAGRMSVVYVEHVLNFEEALQKEIAG
jgi:hypothetical protein